MAAVLTLTLKIVSRDVHSGAAALTVATWQQIFLKLIATAAPFFSGTLKKCMNFIEFQCLQVKDSETE
jgi:hypothetical protein